MLVGEGGEREIEEERALFHLPLKALKSNLRVPVEEGGGREKEEQRIQKERACVMQYKLRNSQKH